MWVSMPAGGLPAKERDAEIDPTARLYGPIFLGKGVEVRPGR